MIHAVKVPTYKLADGSSPVRNVSEESVRKALVERFQLEFDPPIHRAFKWIDNGTILISIDKLKKIINISIPIQVAEKERKTIVKFLKEQFPKHTITSTYKDLTNERIIPLSNPSGRGSNKDSDEATLYGYTDRQISLFNSDVVAVRDFPE